MDQSMRCLDWQVKMQILFFGVWNALLYFILVWDVVSTWLGLFASRFIYFLNRSLATR